MVSVAAKSELADRSRHLKSCMNVDRTCREGLKISSAYSNEINNLPENEIFGDILLVTNATLFDGSRSWQRRQTADHPQMLFALILA